MGKLIAIFTIRLSEGLFLVSRSLDEELCYNMVKDQFEIQLCLNPEASRWQNIYSQAPPKPETDPYYGMTKINISVCRAESEVPPQPRIQKGVKSYGDRQKYFDQRFPEYHAVAVEILERVTLFFKYVLYNPGLQLPNPYSREFQNPKWRWIDGEERVLVTGKTVTVMHPLPERGQFSVRGFSGKDEPSFQNALENRITIELYDEILSDAQTAIVRGNLKRGVLEMAIACEVAVKQFYSNKYPHVTIEGKRVLNLISQEAQKVFGTSFKDMNPLAYSQIDFLFRTRNSVAHEGRVYYRDDSASTHLVNELLLKDWWEAVQSLLQWLETYR